MTSFMMLRVHKGTIWMQARANMGPWAIVDSFEGLLWFLITSSIRRLLLFLVKT